MRLTVTKICAKCKRELPENEFYEMQTGKNGLCSSCKDCVKEERKEYYQEHKEEIRERQSKYNQEHREESRKYRLEHREHRKKWYQEHKEERLILRKSPEYRELRREYAKTERGGETFSRRNSKRRKRNLGSIPFNIFGKSFSEFDNDYHHCNDVIVIRIPRGIHRGNLGSNHREKVVDYFSNLGIGTFQELL